MNSHSDLHSLAEFNLQDPAFVERLKATGEPLILTVDGKAELVVQDAASYEKLLAIAEQARAVEGIRRGLEDLHADRIQPLDAALAAIRRDLDLPPDS